ncbi:MAG: CPBP family intramembrane metalloprotease [Oscillospiraceae bacterium]|nr:CPBP family intramembrane metalloprotease [Oscillospiraceae bacterium]
METTAKIKDYKGICFKLGLIMTIFFISGLVCTLALRYIHVTMSEQLGITAEYILRLVLSGIFLYAIPIISALIILRGENREKLSQLYKKPERLTKALGNFPAIYGLGQMANLTALFIAWIFTKFYQPESSQNETLERSFGTMNSLIPPNIVCGIALFIYMVFAAAIFEEFMCRGLMLNALKPYGNGFAIIVTGFLFGIMHGNFQQFFYAFILGIVLAYITIQTGSIFSATLLHAMFNSLAAVVMLFLSTETIKDFMLDGMTTGTVKAAQTQEETLVLAVFGIFIAFSFLLIIAGIVLAIKKLSRLKSYKADNPFSEISAKKKSLLFFTSIPVIIMLILAVDSFAGGIIAGIIHSVMKI